MYKEDHNNRYHDRQNSKDTHTRFPSSGSPVNPVKYY